MGKSIVHCAACGVALREEEFAARKAVAVDHRAYCFGCVPAELAKAQASRPRRGSTARIPLVTPSTRRIATTTRRSSPLPLVIGIAAVLAIGVVSLVFSRREKAPETEAPKAARPVAAAVEAPAPRSAPPVEEPRKVSSPAPQVRPASAEPERSWTPTLAFPPEGAVFEAPALVRIVIDIPGDALSVDLYEGSTRLVALDDRPYVWEWMKVPVGEYRLSVQVKDKTGRTLTSPAVSIRVTAPAADAPEVKRPAPAPAPVPVDLGVDPRRVDAAIAKGVAFLRAAGLSESMNPGAMPGLGECPELILWTLVHARVPENDPDFARLFNFVMARKLERVYGVALEAMILEEVNRVKYQVRIAQCAQFLMDAQCANGQWSYTGPAQIGTPSLSLRPDVASGGGLVPAAGTGPRVKPKVQRRITSLRKTQDGPPTGDNSNSQYAALGMRACADAGILIPRTLIQRAQNWWRISQHEEEGKPEKRPAVATGEVPAGVPAGWCYGPKDHGHAPYSSMTAGAVGSVAIWNYLADEKTWRKDATLQNGIAWLGRHFTVQGNDGPSEHVADARWMVYYYLYALERAGILAATETFGAHRWYVEGAEAILGAQRPDGSWLAPLPHGDRSETTNQVWDSCFAILFLKRATRPLDVASTDQRAGK